MGLKLGASHSRRENRFGRKPMTLGTKTTTRPLRPASRALRARISNRQFLMRLETSVTLTKQTPEVVSNRHFWDGARAFSPRLIQVQRRTQDANGEMRQVRSVVVELDPTNHAMILQVLRNLRFANSQMFRELRLESAIRNRTALPRSLRRAASRTTCQISKSYAQSLAGFHIVRRDLIGIRKQKHSGSRWRGIGIIQFMQWARYQPSQHRIELRHPRSQRRIASASVSGAL